MRTLVPRLETLEDRIAPASWSGAISSNTTWSNAQVQNITGNVDVDQGVTLTIQAGTVVQFNNGTNLTVDGTLTAQGASGQTIYFTSVNDNSPLGGSNNAGNGNWGDILFNSDSMGSVLNNVAVRYGGGGDNAEIEADGAAPTISNSTINNSSGYGVHLVGSNATLTGDTFQNNNSGAIHIDLASQPTIQSPAFTNNYINGVAVDGGTLPAGTTTWDNPDVAYVPTGEVTVPQGATLDIGAGQVIKFGYNGFSLVVQGTLQAQGTASQPVVFTSIYDDANGGDTNNIGSGSNPGPNQWNQLQFTSTSTASTMNYVDVLYGGANNAVAAEVEADGSAPTISNSTIGYSGSYGVRLVGSNATLTDDAFQNNNNGAISMDMASQPTIQGPTFTNNYINGVALDGGNLPAGATITWDNPDIVYVPRSEVTVPQGATLDIGAGQVIKFGYNGFSLVVQGTLQAQGTASQPVVFTSIYDDANGGDTNNDGTSSNPGPNQWNQLQFTSTSTASAMNNVDVLYGGSDVAAEVEADGSAPTISNTTIGYSGSYGVRLVGSNATLTGDTFQKDNNGAISMDMASQPTIQSPTFTNNYINGVAVDGGTLPAGTTTWDNPAVAYVPTGEVTVPQGATLDIGAGQVIKFGYFGYSLVVQGTLQAQGTASQPVVFTSFEDGTIDGDTNNNSSSSPAVFNWGQIQFTSTSTNSVLNYADVRWGSEYVNAEIEADGSSPTISNSIITDSGNYGVRLVGSDAILTGDTFQNDGFNFDGPGAAIEMDVDSQPVITGITFTNNHINAVEVDGGTLPAGTTTWNNPDAVYWPSGNITVPQGSTLAINAGQIIKLNASLIVQGTLLAQGTAGNPITFTSEKDDTAGGDTNNDGSTSNPAYYDWGQIQFTSTSTNSVLNYADVRWGSEYVNAEIEADGSSPTISNCVVSDSGNYGLRLVGSDAILTGDTFQNDGFNFDGPGAAIEMDAASQPTIQSIQVTNNHINGIEVDGGSLTAGDTTTWNTPGLVYWISGNLTVPQTSTLALDAGVVLKLSGYGGGTVAVAGTLLAQGTALQPVIFTSQNDDSAGDVNNPANPTSGQPGDWAGIQFTSTSTGSVMDHVDIRYGGQVGVDALSTIEVDGASLTMTDSTESYGVHAGIVTLPGSNVTLTSDLWVQNAAGTAMDFQAGSTATVFNNTIDGNLFGLILDGATVTFVNNLVTNSSNTGIYERVASTLTFTNNDVNSPGSVNGNYFGLTDPTGTDGNLAVDPQYFNEPGGQYELRPGSPAEDAGTGTGAPTTDFFGNPRFQDPDLTGRGDGSGTDIGAIWVEQTATSNIDLATTAVSGPATALEDQSVTVNWTVQSVGTGTATGSWHDAVYLSANPVFTPDAILLGEVQHTGDLGPGQSYNASASFTLPGVTPGNYYFLVRCNSENEVFEGDNLANNVAGSAPVAMTLPALTIGSSLNGTLAATGSSEAYQVTTTAGGNLNLALTGASGDANQLFVSFGSVPTQEVFDESAIQPNLANQTISLANAQAGTYYILVYGANVPSAENFTLTAATPSFSITSVSPAQGSNTGQVTLSISGAEFKNNSQPQLVDSAGVTIQPVNVYYSNSGLISATFNLTGLPAGPANVEVVNTGGATTSLPQGFDIIAGSPEQLVTNLVVPSAVRAGRTFTIEVQYKNVGDTDLLAPILQISSTGPDEISFTSDFAYEGTSLNLVAVSSTGPAGILAPGASGEITLYGTATTTGTDNFTLAVGTYDTPSIDWASIETSLRPENLTDTEWAALFAQVKQDIGNSWSNYQQIISNDATLLPAGLGNNYSLNDVFKLVFDQAQAQLGPSTSGQLFLGDASQPLGNVPISIYDPATGNAFSTVTLNDGTFLFPGAGQASYDVMLGAYVLTSPDTLVVGANGLSGAQLFAAPQGEITGSVVLTPGGSPLVSELVTAVNQNGQTFSAETDANGTYTIGALPAGVYQVSAGGDAYTPSAVGNVTVAAGQVVPNVALALQVGGTIQGTVTADGTPVADAVVTAMGQDGTELSAETADDGTYTITGLPGESYTVNVLASGFGAQQLTGVNVPSGGTVSAINFSLAQAGSIQGTVTDTVTGQPDTGVSFEITGSGGTFSAESDSTGEFTVADVPAGTYTITSLSADQGFMTATAQVTVIAGATAQVTVAEAALGQVTGTVTNSVNGQPVGNVTVYAAQAGGVVTATTTDNSGAYDLTGLDAGSYQIIVGDVGTPGLAQAQVSLDPTSTTATANLTAALIGSVSGTVFASDGATPIDDATVALVQNGVQISSMATDATGNYVFDIAVPGTYQLEAGSDDAVFPAITGVTVSAGTTLTGLNFTAGTDVVNGSVTDASTGQAISGAVVLLSRADAGLALTAAGSTDSAADGTFQFAGLAPGSYIVSASAAGYAYGSQVISVTNSGPVSVTLSLGAQSTWQGTIRDANTAAPLAGATLSLFAASGFNTTTMTDANGNYTFAQLAPGTYTLLIETDGYETSVLSNLTLGQGNMVLNSSLTPASINVSGTVSNSAGPLGQVEVVALNANGFPVAQTSTASDGTFTLTTVPPGTFSVIAGGQGYFTSAPVPLTVTAGANITGLTINLTAAAISDITINPPFSQFVNTATATNSPQTLLQPPPNPAFTFDPGELALLGGQTQVSPQCAKQLSAAKQALNTLSNLKAASNNLYTTAKNNLALLPTVLDALNSEYNSLAISLNLVNQLLDQFGQDPEVATIVDILNFVGQIPTQAGVQKVINAVNTAVDAGSFGGAQTALQNAYSNSVTTLEHQVALVCYVLTAAEGGNPAQYSSSIGGFFLALLKLKTIPNYSEQINKALGSLPDDFASIFKQLLSALPQLLFNPVERLKTNVQKLADIEGSFASYQNNLTAYYQQVMALATAMKALECCVNAHPQNPSSQVVPQVTPDASASGFCPTCGCTSVTCPGDNDTNDEDQDDDAGEDPNNMTGPAGYGPQNFIQPETMAYRVDFENDPTKATAAVQVVTATFTIDPNLDPGTFAFTGFGFGQFNFTIPAGLYHYQTTIDLRPDGIDLLVPVTLDENPATGVVTVEFQSLDPATMEPPDGINAGFLPVDDAAGDGEGYFTYTVQPKAGLPTGTVIKEQASIVFDTNAPLNTPTAVNTIDTGTNLTSSVAALPTTSPGSFTINWSGTDTGGSGVAFYSIYYSDNGGPLTPFLTDTTQTSATFTGVGGHTYTFDSIATDNIGNIQPIPATLQATTTISANAASHLAITSKVPAKITAGSSFNVTVEALNNSGKVDPTFDGAVTLTLNGPAQLAGPTTVVATAGVATFTGLTIDTAGSGFTFQAGTLVLTPGTSSSFSVTPAAATQFVVTTEPPASVAANAPFPVAISAEDAFGNVVGTFSGKVSLALLGGGKLVVPASASAVNGVATFSGLMIDTAANGYSLKAASGKLAGLSSSFAVTPLTATKLVVRTQPPASVTAGVPFAVTISAEDNFGNVDPTFTGNVGLTLSGNGSLSGTTSMPASAGVATFTGLSIAAPGTGYTLQASATGLTSATSNKLSVAASQNLQLVVSGEPPLSVPSGSGFSVTVEVESDGMVDTHFTGPISLALAGNAGLAHLAGLTTVKAKAGVATFNGLGIGLAGSSYTLLASAAGVASQATSGFAVTAGAVKRLVVATQPPASVAAGGGGFVFTVAAEDAFGNVNPNFDGTINVTLSRDPTKALLNGANGFMAVNGVAQITGLTIDTAGSGYALTASSGKLTSATTGSLSVTAGAATHLVITSPSKPLANVKAGSGFTVVVSAEDKYGNVDTTFNGTVSLALENNPGNTLLHGPVSVAASGGVAIFTGLSLDTAASGYTLGASSGSLTPTTSVSVTITPGAATQLVVTSQPAAGIMAGTAFGLTVAAEDAFGNVATSFTGSVSLTLSVNPGMARLGGSSTVTAKAGVASFHGLTLETAASGYAIKASARGLKATTTDDFDIAQ